MELRQVMQQSFVLIPAEWSADKARRFIAGNTFTHLIASWMHPADHSHYLFGRAEAHTLLDEAGFDTLLADAFGLAARAPADTLEANSNAEDVPRRAVVVEGGRVVGFFDEDAPPPSRSIDAVRRWRTRDRERPSGDRRISPFEAYPLLSMPAVVAAGAAFDVVVGFQAIADANWPGDRHMRIDSPDPSEQCVVVLVPDGMVLERDFAYLPLDTDAQVRISATLKAGVAEVSVKALYFYKGQLIGTTQRTASARHSAAATFAEVINHAAGRITMPEPQSCVDLTVTVSRMRDGALEWRLSAPSLSTDVSTRRLSTSLADAQQFASELLRDLGTQNNIGGLARNLMETKGQEIAALIPPEFFEILHAVHAQVQRAPTLLLITSELYVPWELAYLAQPLDPAAPPFLAAQTQMGRWLDDVGILPSVVTQEVGRMTAVASRYGLGTDLRELPHALIERDALCRNWKAIPLEAVASELEAMSAGQKIANHLVHFAVHAHSDPATNNQVILLADRTSLPAGALDGAYMSGQPPRFAFVFLNACQVGTPGWSLGQSSGFPGFLIRHGASGFIAPLWEVDDELARDVAEAFYTATLSGGQAIGAVLCEQRRSYERGSTTPMAYIYYGHPCLRLKVAEGAH